MVGAILNRTKTQTRRTRGLEIINQNPDDWQFEWGDFALEKPWRFTKISSLNEKSLRERNFIQEAIKCPYGKPGDILWVKETSVWVNYDDAHDLLEGVKDRNQFVYRSSVHNDWMEYAKERYGYKWTPSIHMPKLACRIFLEIETVGVQRLQSITSHDAQWEGFEENGESFYGRYRTLWEQINGKGSWDKNPWIWFLKFKQIKKPNNFITPIN